MWSSLEASVKNVLPFVSAWEHFSDAMTSSLVRITAKSPREDISPWTHGSQPLWLGQWVTVNTRSLSLSLSLSDTHSQTMILTRKIVHGLPRKQLCGCEKLVCCRKLQDQNWLPYFNSCALCHCKFIACFRCDANCKNVKCINIKNKTFIWQCSM